MQRVQRVGTGTLRETPAQGLCTSHLRVRVHVCLCVCVCNVVQNMFVCKISRRWDVKDGLERKT